MLNNMAYAGLPITVFFPCDVYQALKSYDL